jgi:hypothetical protein
MSEITKVALVPVVLTILSGCGAGTGAGVEANPDLTPPADQSTLTLNGPPAATQDVQLFKINLWDNVAAVNRCGGCHNADPGGQLPNFARNDDINLAYQQANTVVDLASPQDSRLVAKVGGGHHCWLTADQACADIMTTWITGWAGGSLGSTGNEITLRAPGLKDPGASKTFPADSVLFGATVHPLVTTTALCFNCHSEVSAIAQTPFFASADVNAAYEAVKSKISLDDPASSRLVVRLRDEFHNGWTGDFQADADTMQAAIQAFADGIPDSQVDPNTMMFSKALSLQEGTLATGAGRHEANAIGIYQFKTGSGPIAFDTSGVDPAADLSLTGNVEWVGGFGLRFTGGKAQATTADSKKFHDLIKATGEYTIEAWVTPANVTQEMARIVSYSGSTTTRNFGLGQTLYNYDFFHRSSLTDLNGDPALSTPDADEVLQATKQHVVATYDPFNGRRLYVNGELIDVVDMPGGTLDDWDDTFALVMGNEVSSDGVFAGTLRMVVIHNRALTASQITDNFEGDVGEQFFMLFSVSHLIPVPDAYVVFEVEQFDSYSYLFNAPFFAALSGAVPADIPLQGMRIGINGAEAKVGQGYANLDVVLGLPDYVVGEGQLLSTIGTTIAIEKGPDMDEFFLTFDVLGANTMVRVGAPLIVPAPPPDGDPVSDIGIRTFDEINATMSAVTGVPTTMPAVANVYSTVKQTLPAVENIESFLSSHQMAISQLSLEYCSSLVDDATLAAAFFPGFNFGAAPAAAFDAAGRDLVIDPLIAKVNGANLASQPADAAVKAELNALVDKLTVCVATNTCEADRTAITVKATCAAALGSAAMLIQ